MKFRAEEYYHAGLERMKQAESLYRTGGDYALAMYCSGLAVECLLRAFRWREDASFEGRHDLHDLLKASGLLRLNDEYMRRRGKSDEDIRELGIALRAAMNEVVILWHNNLRFASEVRLRAFLKGIKRLQGGKGDPLKRNALDLINASQTMINRGILLWQSKTRS